MCGKELGAKLFAAKLQGVQPLFYFDQTSKYIYEGSLTECLHDKID